MPPILSMDLPAVHGEVDVKTAWIPGFPGFAIKVSPGFFDNPKLGLPSLNGLMILFSATTGLVEAVFLDNGYLTDLRTAAAGAVAARHLAPATVDHLRRHRHRRAGAAAGRRRRIWCGRSSGCWSGAAMPTKAGGLRRRHRGSAGHRGASRRRSGAILPPKRAGRHHDAGARAGPDGRHGCDRRGLHITAMGSDQSGKNEIDPRRSGRGRPLCLRPRRAGRTPGRTARARRPPGLTGHRRPNSATSSPGKAAGRPPTTD